MKPTLYNTVENAQKWLRTAPLSDARKHVAALLECIYGQRGKSAEDARALAAAHAEINTLRSAELRRAAGWDGTGAPVGEEAT